jgi:cellulose synthase/poly-beta-1,6-N-acetylglucosamine synthase-like glycosyltransferase
VTVVIPVGEPGPFLGRQVQAVMAQRTFFSFDVVLACNACHRGACASLDALRGEIGDPRLRVVPAHERRSPAYARNMGAASSDAEVLAFCDADDEVAPGWLAALVGAVSHRVAVGGHLDERRFAVPRQEGWRPPVTPGALPTFLGVPYAVSANMAVEHDAFEDVGGFDDGLLRCEDIALSWRLQSAGVELEFAPEAVIHYRHRSGVRALMRQHYLYGRGMAQVLHRYGVPRDGGAEHLSGVAALRPNNQAMEHKTFVGTVVRRGSIAAGRVVGLAAERRHHPAGSGAK